MIIQQLCALNIVGIELLYNIVYTFLDIWLRKTC